MRVLIVGCGYVGIPLGAELVRLGHEVYGLRRSPSAAIELGRAGIQLVTGDVTRPDWLKGAVVGFDWVINTVSSSKGGLDDYRAVYLEGTRNLLAALAPRPPAKYVFTSSTSVYGQTDGRIVTEESPTVPASATSRVLVETEGLLREACGGTGFPAITARLAGIYGPGRGYLFQQYMKDKAVIAGEGKRYLNMIHLADVVGALLAIVQHGRPGETYNVVDNEPVTQLAFFEWLSQRLSKPMPPFVAELPERKRGLTNKRVSNQRLRTQTGYQFLYPTFRDGYEAMVRENWPIK